jgi:protein O-GlcNAc transferase
MLAKSPTKQRGEFVPMSANIEETFAAALAALRAGKAGDAERLFKAVISIQPRHVAALNLLGIVLVNVGKLGEAEDYLRRALIERPDSDSTLYNYGILLRSLHRPAEALEFLGNSLKINSSAAQTWFNRGLVLGDLNRHEEAISDFDRAIGLEPRQAAFVFNKARSLAILGRFTEALPAFETALILNPDLAEAWCGRGNICLQLARYGEALTAFDRALALQPLMAEAWLGRGNVLFTERRPDEALTSYESALAARPDYAEANSNKSAALFGLKRYEEAFAASDKAFRANPNLEHLAGRRLFAKLQVCDWANLDEDADQLLSAIRHGQSASVPFCILPIASSPADQQKCARLCTASMPHFAISPRHPYANERLRIAYLSADFGEHPTGHLMTGLFEQHDRSRFEVTGISFGPNDQSPIRRRLEAAFDRFVDVAQQSDQVIAEQLRQHEIDIAIDLMGHTQGARPAILARRPAPIQVSYFGYLGTMGADFIDYVIGDEIALPFDQQEHYSEKIVHVPDCFLVQDDCMPATHPAPPRRQAGLPDEGFVFCCFNNSYKITKSIFEIWMRLLRAVDGSLLWLAESNPTMAENLRREARESGVEPDRLLFAPRVPLSAHLARQSLADLFLDTSPYNAGATGAAALRAGVPVITVIGETFVGRMAASMLHALGLPELATESLAEYEDAALKIATNAALLRAVKAKLARNRTAFPFFDTGRFARHIEVAYQTMWRLHREGEPPRSFSVAKERH